MFSKRIKFVRDLQQEIDILFKKADREVSKLNDNIHSEIKKKLRKFSPGIQVHVSKLSEADFRKKQKRTIPISVFISEINGKKIHKNGFWVEEMWSEDKSDLDMLNFDGLIKVENILTVEELQDVCFELSEELDIDVQIRKIEGKVNY